VKRTAPKQLWAADDLEDYRGGYASSIDVDGPSDERVFTGLLDLNGDPIYREVKKVRMGFLK